MTATSVPTAVLFDLDETLIPETEPLAAAYMAVARAVWGPDATEAHFNDLRTVARAFWESHAPHPEYRKLVHVGPSDGLSSEFAGDAAELTDLRAFLPSFRAHAFDASLPPGFSGPREQLREIWWSARMGTQTVFPGAYELLEALRGTYKLALVTNGASDFQRHKVAFTDLGHRFDAVIVAGDLGVGKPNPDPFLAALAALDVRTDEAVMIGNDQDRDIAGAQALGIRTIWVQPGDPTQRDAVTDLSEIPALLAG